MWFMVKLWSNAVMALVLFTVAWIVAIYLFNSAFARRLKKIEIKIALLYITSIALIGVFGEVFSDSFYSAIFNQPLWLYRVLPIHDGFTSMYSIVLWAMYGFYLYLLHDNLSAHNHSDTTFAAIISIEAIVLEILINVSHLLIFGGYIFYYLPSDLWHLTSIQAIPFYFLAGLVVTKSIKRLKADPVFFSIMNTLLIFVLIFLVK